MAYRRIVVKIGTSTLTAGTKRLSPPHMVDLARQTCALHDQGIQVAWVSSGAITAGRETLGYPVLPGFIPAKQMLAAIGQPRLMGYYENYFAIFGKVVAQVLLTRADIADRRRYLNARETLESLLRQGVVPIINENDTVATEEIRVGDNDNLSALVANLIEADLLLLLTDQAGLFTADPRQDPAAELIGEVTGPEISPAIWQAAGGTHNGLGTGGMVTKLQAADLARRGGTTVVIAHGGEPDILLRVASQEKVGTRLTPIVSTLEHRKRFFLAGMRSTRAVTIDDGALQALAHGGSLLPVGVCKVEGSFERGDAVRVLDLSGKEVAVGLVNYPARDLVRLGGRHSSEIEEMLGYSFGDEVIHRDNLMLL